MNFSLLQIGVIVIVALLGIGLYGVLAARNLIKMIVGLQIAAKGAILALALAGQFAGKGNLGQSMALTVIVADTIVAVVALAFAVQIRRRFGTLDVKSLTTLRR